MHRSVQDWIDRDFLVGAATAVLVDGEVVDQAYLGHARRGDADGLSPDTIFRIYSNTKPITSVAAMMLVEGGLVELDDPVEQHLPEFADLQVLRAGATEITDTEPLVSKPTIRQLFCHNAGLSYGVFQESILDPVITERGLFSPQATLADMVAGLGELPLANQPGRRWQYSLATDVLARLVEVKSGQRFDEFLKARIFDPLGMVDTDFWVPPEKAHRLAGNYAPVDPMDPMKAGLNDVPDALIGNYLEQRPMLSGGGGLTSTIGDYTRFIRMLIGGGALDGERLLRAETVASMHTNQLPPGVELELPAGWTMPNTVFGLGFAIKTAPAEGEPDSATGEFHWGGLAGTHSWIAPEAGVAAIIFTQRLPGFWHPFSHDFKREVYRATT